MKIQLIRHLHLQVLIILMSVSVCGQNPPVLTAPLQKALGETATYQIMGAPPSTAYVLDFSEFGSTPGLHIPETGRVIPLTPPYLLAHHRLHEITPYFVNCLGTTDATGSATALFHVPLAPFLHGKTLSACFATQDLSTLDGIGTVSNPVQTFLYSQTPTQYVSSVSQHGITWTFSQPHHVGQFVNGDYWVWGPVDIISISPPSANISGRTMHGSMVDPMADTIHHGYDSTMYGQYENGQYKTYLNAALGVSASSPLSLSGVCSLISSISLPSPHVRPQIQTQAILTVLDSLPPPDAFRPPYAGTNKSVAYTYSQLNTSLLQNLTPVASTPSLQSVSDLFERPWIDHIEGWLQDYQHPEDNMPHYGREISDQISFGALMLHLDFPLAQKKELLVRFIQLGIDFKGVADANGFATWTPNGGVAHGRKYPIVLAGMMLGDPSMIAVTHTATSGVLFGEDAQTFIVTSGPNGINGGNGGYTSAHIGLPEWGIRHATNPSIDNVSWAGANYRRCCTANSWIGVVLAALLTPGAKTQWNHDALFMYQDRYMATEPPGWRRAWSQFPEDMWDTYRPLLGSVWPAP